MAVVLGVMPLLRTRSAALRHGVLAAAVACAVALPLLEAVVPSWSIQLPVQPGMPAQMESPQHVAAGAPSVTATVDPTTTPAASSRAWLSIEAAEQIIGAAWLAGVGVSLIALLVGLGRLARLARRATPMADAVWVHSLTDIARSVGLHRPVRLLQSDHPAFLAAWGWWTPTVMVPRSARDWSDARVRIVLRHELAHLRRGDWLAQMAAELLRAACWFNPLVWILRSRLRFESERACDDAVLDRECDAADYATHLVEIARTLASPRRSASSLPVSAMARSAGLERRVSAMLHPHVDRRPLSRTHRLAIATTLLALTCTIAGAVTAAQALSSLAGTVLDPTDRVLPNVRVVLTDPANQSKHEVRSDASGRFEFAGVPAGDYALEAFLPGFATLRGR